MKLSRILPLVVGSAVAGILTTTSPAHALTYNWTLSNLTFNDGSTGGGTLTYDDFLNEITNVNINVASTAVGNLSFVAPPSANILFSDNSVLDILTSSKDENLLLTFSPTLDTINPSITAGSSSFYDYNNSSNRSNLTGGTISAAAVPFDIPGGATIPTVGSLLALAAMRKVRKSMASKTSVASPAYKTVS